MIRQLDTELFQPSRRRRATRCSAAGCDEATREGKPFCTEHVEEHDYVQDLLATLEAQDAEIQRVARLGARAVDPEGLTACEILNTLRVHGPRTVRRLARELNHEAKVLEAYVKALERRGLVTKDKKGRKRRRLVHLVAADAAPIDRVAA